MKVSNAASASHPPAKAEGGGGGTEENFLLNFFFQKVYIEGRENPEESGAEEEGGEGNPRNRLTAGRGRGAPEVEGAWDGEAGLGAGSSS